MNKVRLSLTQWLVLHDLMIKDKEDFQEYLNQQNAQMQKQLRELMDQG
jgi:hypothetical protein